MDDDNAIFWDYAREPENQNDTFMYLNQMKKDSNGSGFSTWLHYTTSLQAAGTPLRL